jgi:hypothetical protein
MISVINAVNEMKQPAIRMMKALLKCLIDSRGIRWRSFIFIHFEAEGTYRIIFPNGQAVQFLSNAKSYKTRDPQ